MIHHLSYPSGQSVNDSIDSRLCSVQYTSFDKAVELVQNLGKGCLLGKSDIESAFRLIPIAPSDFDLLGFYFQGKYYYDKCLPFGCSISPATFELFSSFLEYAVRNRSKQGEVLHYLDDFLFGGRSGSNECSEIMAHFKQCMFDLGVPIALEKTEGPKTIIIFLGLEIDTELLQIKMPQTKIQELVNKITLLLAKEKTTLTIMQSVIGSLQFACRAIIPGRPFIRRLINSICGLTRPYHHVRITKSMKLDLTIWLKFFQDFNGIHVFHDRFWLTNIEAEWYTDSAASAGFGIYFAGRWCASPWPITWYENNLTENICVLELFPIIVALYMWGNQLRNKKVLLHSDNMAVVQAINKMTSKSDDMMTLLRIFTLKCLEYNLLVKAEHIPGFKNSIADSLSRLQFERFRELAPLAQKAPDEIPQHLWSIFNKQQRCS